MIKLLGVGAVGAFDGAVEFGRTGRQDEQTEPPLLTALGRFLVASRFMRAFYGLAKAVVFCVLYLTHALALKNPEILVILHPLNQILIFLTVGLCILRGIPVVLDGQSSPEPGSEYGSRQRGAATARLRGG